MDDQEPPPRRSLLSRLRRHLKGAALVTLGAAGAAGVGLFSLQRIRQGAALREAENLIEAEGERAYEVALRNAGLSRDQGRRSADRFWSLVAQEIARRTGQSGAEPAPRPGGEVG